MSELKRTNFETVFYPFLKKVLNEPSLMNRNGAELKAILNQIRFLNKPGELDTILPDLWELKLVVPKPYNTNSGIITEIETNLRNMFGKPKNERVNILNAINAMSSGVVVSRVKTSDKQQKAVMDFIRG